MHEPEPKVHFEEHQRFTQWWIWLTVLLALFLPVGIFAYSLHQQRVVGGDTPTTNTGLIVSGIACVIAGFLPLAIIYATRLTTLVRDDGLFIRFRPFHLRLKPIDTASATSIEAVTYRPLREYGGWGIRYTRRGKAYNIRGNQGVRIHYPDGNHILIGSQHAEKLAAAIHAMQGKATAPLP